MSRLLLLAFSLILAVLDSDVVSGQLVETGINRSNSVVACGQLLPPEACNNPADQTLTGDGPWMDTLFANEGTTGLASGTASQVTDIQNGLYSGVISVICDGDSSGAAISDAQAQSTVEILFTLSTATDVDFNGTVDITSGPNFSSTSAEVIVTTLPPY